VTRAPGGGGLAILGYHHIGPRGDGGAPTRWHLSVPTFERHLALLRGGGWRVIGVDALVRGLTRGDALPRNGVLLTFDDCHRSLRSVALPRLQRFGYPAVAFAPTDFVGATNAYDRAYAPEEPLCDWTELAELEAAGVSVQSHSATHRGLSWLTAAEQEEELRRSKAAIEARLSKRVDVFALPYGDDKVDPTALALMYRSAGYRAACLFGGGVNPLPLADPYRLERIAIEESTDLESVLTRSEAHGAELL
jgi:peptidoglycan/xylan/chitin deacetylase (PgdA/CDA1 family)